MILRVSVALFALAGAALAETAPDDVAFDDYGAVAQSLTGQAGDPENGIKVMTTAALGNCVACHQVSALDEFLFHGEVGPSLDGAGSRWTEAELRGIVANAKMMFDGTVMPAFFKTHGYIRPGDAYTGKAGAEPLPPLLTAQQIEDVVAFLATLKDE